MKKLFLCFVSILTVVFSFQARADLLAGWDFNDLTSGVLNPTTISATVGSGTLDLSALDTSASTNFSGSTINTFTGGSSSAGQALSIVNNPSGNKSILFTFSMLGYQDLIITFAGRGTSTGFNSGVWSWSTDGNSYTDVSGINTATTSTSYALKTADLSLIDSIENVATVYLQYTLSGATSTAGNNRIDNLQFNATAIEVVPEPSTFALAALGGVACFFALSRKK